jgi:hypothetical protein
MALNAVVNWVDKMDFFILPASPSEWGILVEAEDGI